MADGSSDQLADSGAFTDGARAIDRRRMLAGTSLLATAAVVVGCSPTVRVEAPSEPIEINLNVRIEQEVRIRVDRELEQVFSDNDDIF
ncbi:MAG: YnbE family lipoprotein [Pseudomonadota bacterium]